MSLAASYATYVVRVHTRHGIKTLSFDHLAVFFPLTAKRAAEELGISSRTLIRVCRSLGIRRWPYLGFRSEQNVHRIRHEAIENLRRKLEREGPVMNTTILQSDDTSMRGASAKRLLQVSAAPVPTVGADNTVTLSTSARLLPSILPPPPVITTATTPHVSSMMPLQTPPPVHQSFHLDHISPRKLSPTPVPKRSTDSMPSLHVLVDASILTAFKHQVAKELQPSTPSSPSPSPAFKMSMRDILATTAM